MPDFCLDLVNGNDAADGSTFALGGLPTVGPWRTVTSGATAARIAPGDVIKLAKSPVPTDLGQDALWTNTSKDVVLQTGAVTAEIDNFESADANWTESANVTDTDDTTYYKLGVNSYKLAIGASFTTGKAAYRDFGAGNEKDLSGYQQISFWLRNSVALASAGDVKIKLCSDAIGEVAVDTFSLPAIPSINAFLPITLNKGSALGSSIRSVSIWMDTDLGALDLYFDNLIACKAIGSADSLTLNSLISKTSGHPWFPIQSINGTTIKIDNITSTLGNAGRGYTGTTETTDIYKRECILVTAFTTMPIANTTRVMAVQDSGTLDSFIQFQGGYNTADGLQDGETFVDCLNGYGYGFDGNGKYCFKANKINVVRAYIGIGEQSSSDYHVEVGDAAGIGCSYAALHMMQSMARLTGTIYGINCSYSLSGRSIRATGDLHVYGAITAGPSATYLRAKNVYAKNNGIGISQNCHIEMFYSGYNGIAVQLSPGVQTLRLLNTDSMGTGETVSSTSIYPIDAKLCIQKFNGNADDQRIYRLYGTIFSEATVVHSSGLSWKLSPDLRCSSVIPLDLEIAQVACAANKLVTIKAWMRRSNTGLTMSLVCPGGQLAGVASDVSASMTAIADTWEELTITFTPTEAGVVSIEAQAYGGTTYSGYVDDLTIEQAA